MQVRAAINRSNRKRSGFMRFIALFPQQFPSVFYFGNTVFVCLCFIALSEYSGTDKMSYQQAIPTRVYVGNLHHSVRERDLERFFKNCGRVKEILIKKNYGFVVR